MLVNTSIPDNIADKLHDVNYKDAEDTATIFFLFFLTTKEPFMAKPFGLSIGTQTSSC